MEKPATKPKKSSRLKWILTCVLLMILVLVFAALSAPSILRMQKNANATEAVNNARQIMLAMYEFEAEYGMFPSAESAALVAAATGKPVPAPNTHSNTLLQQLFISKVVMSENVFFTRAPGTLKPDDVWRTPTGEYDPATCLAAGENGWGYITLNNAYQSAHQAADTAPILVSPLQQNSLSFDPTPYKKTMVYATKDGSVRSVPIEHDGLFKIKDQDSPALPFHPLHSQSLYGAGVKSIEVLRPRYR